jgi:hypothetical protein
MSKKNQRRQQEQQRTQAADAQVKAQATEPKRDNTPEPSTDVIKSKVGVLINEVVGVAEANKEHLETSTFVRRFNQLATNHHPRLALLAVSVSDGSQGERKANVLHESEVVGTWAPGSHRNGAGEDLQAPVVDNVLHEGNASLNEQNGVEYVAPSADNGLTISDAGRQAGAAPVEGQPDSAVVVTTSEVAAEAQTGSAPTDMKLPEEKTVLEGAVPASNDLPSAPNPEQVPPAASSAAGLEQVNTDKPNTDAPAPVEKSAEDLAAEEQAKKDQAEQK